MVRSEAQDKSYLHSVWPAHASSWYTVHGTRHSHLLHALATAFIKLSASFFAQSSFQRDLQLRFVLVFVFSDQKNTASARALTSAMFLISSGLKSTDSHKLGVPLFEASLSFKTNKQLPSSRT